MTAPTVHNSVYGTFGDFGSSGSHSVASGQSIGSAVDDRIVVVTLSFRDYNGFLDQTELDSIVFTEGGSSAGWNIEIDVGVDDTGGSYYVFAAWKEFDSGDGTTLGELLWSWTGSTSTNYGRGSWSVTSYTGADLTTPISDSGYQHSTGSGSLSVSLTIPTDGLAFVFGHHDNSITGAVGISATHLSGSPSTQDGDGQIAAYENGMSSQTLACGYTASSSHGIVGAFVINPATGGGSSASVTLASPEAVTFTGLAPTAAAGAGAVLGSPESITFTGLAPTVVAGSSAAVTLASPEAVTFTGLAPTVVAGTGAAATLAAPEAVTFTGLTPTVQADASATLGSPDAVTFTGLAPTVATGVGASVTLAAPESVTFTGLAPGVAAEISASVTLDTPDAITLTGLAPTVVAEFGASATLASPEAITFTGLAPTVSTLTDAAVTLGAPESIVFTGLAPTPEFDTVRELPAPGRINVIGLAPIADVRHAPTAGSQRSDQLASPFSMRIGRDAEGREIVASYELLTFLEKVRIAADGRLTGNGSPEGVIIAEPGAEYRDLDGGAGATLYVKETGSGNTGWVAK